MTWVCYINLSENVLISECAVSRKQRIIQALEDSDQPLSTNQVASNVGEHWKSVDNELHELLEAGKVEKKALSNRLTLWWDREIPL